MTGALHLEVPPVAITFAEITHRVQAAAEVDGVVAKYAARDARRFS
jgi:hypothetical protein